MKFLLVGYKKGLASIFLGPTLEEPVFPISFRLKKNMKTPRCGTRFFTKRGGVFTEISRNINPIPWLEFQNSVYILTPPRKQLRAPWLEWGYRTADLCGQPTLEHEKITAPSHHFDQQLSSEQVRRIGKKINSTQFTHATPFIAFVSRI